MTDLGVDVNQLINELRAKNEALHVQLGLQNAEIANLRLNNEQLKQTPHSLDELESVANIGHYITNFEAGLWTSSRTLDNIFGIDETYNRSVEGWVDLVHPEDREMMTKYLNEEVIAQHKPFDKDYRIKNKLTGETRWVHGLGEVKFDESSKILSMIGTIQDITEQKLAEDALKESEKNFRNFANRLPQIVFRIDLDGRIIYANDGAYIKTGYTKEDVKKGVNAFELIIPEDHERLRSNLEATLSGKEIDNVEYTFVNKDGSTYPGLLYRTLNRRDNGTLIDIVGIITDITERKKMETNLAFKTQLLEVQSEVSIDGILAVNNEGKSILFNKRFGEIWQIPQEVLDTKDDKTMLEYVSKQLKDPAEFYSKVAYLYEHKNETSREEIEFIDGRYFDRYSSYMTSADGKYIGRIWFFRDITHRKLMEQKLNEQKNLMSAVYNSMSNIVFVLGSDGTILNDLSSTSKGLFGISKQVIGKQINAILPMNLADKVHATINETLSNNKSSLLEFELEQKGTKKHYHIEFSPLDKDRVVANAIDDTEQYTLLTAIQESNQTKNLLFSIIAHDLRNPIGTIQGYANLINDHFDRRDILSSEDLVTSVKGLKISGEAAFELLEQLMNWCQLQMGNVTYNPKPIPVTKLIEQSYHPLIPSANLKSIIIENNLKDNLSVYVDIPSMELVIRNLTNNAIKYTNKGGRIVYDAYLDEKDTNVCEIVVHDNGIGMSQDIINKLHNRIKTTKDSRQGTAGEKGTNLGFYLAEEYVKLNHGEIYVESPGEGLGSIIRVKLPVYKHTENI